MLKTIVSVSATLAIAFGLAIWASDFVLDRFDGFGELPIGQWHAMPAAGTADADPYVKASAARKAYLPIGVAEGLPFYASTDSDGRDLRRGCRYRLSGTTPIARLWTLHAALPDHTPLAPRAGLHAALHSRNVIFDPQGHVTITVSPDASPGNWLPVEGNGPFVLVMSLYDTPASSASGLANLAMPKITRLAGGPNCNG